MKEITAGDGSGDANNERRPMFPKLTYLNGLNIVNMISLTYFDVNIMPYLDHMDGDLFVETVRMFLSPYRKESENEFYTNM